MSAAVLYAQQWTTSPLRPYAQTSTLEEWFDRVADTPIEQLELDG